MAQQEEVDHLRAQLTALATELASLRKNRLQLQQSCRLIRQHFESALRRVVKLGHQCGERTPWTKTVGTCHRFSQEYVPCVRR